MGSTRKCSAPQAHLAGPPDDFDDLRRAFEARMRSERIQFVALSAALASRGDDPEAIFGDLEFRAHKLRGAAQIFEAIEFAHAANALEQAAIAASRTHAGNADPAVWAALGDLVSLIGNLGITEIEIDV
ncbi:MAG TPA: Hpt domain-containing protein [Steroidobacteraceae bacterium]|jgi:HPt (histidine-containing phosphotransfer) domain-containing protein